MALIEVENLKFTYPHQSTPALDGVSLEIEDGSFTLLCGPSGGGKTSLLRHLKTALTPFGSTSGVVRFDGRPLSEVKAREQTERIGFVYQSPENQLVTDKVWHELAFGLESLGLNDAMIRRRVAEMASFFGIQEWYHKATLELSGGQKQILNIASVMVMQPDLLVLDEPSSQLDPIAATDLFTTLRKINDELGTTILLSEQRLEVVLPLADRVLVVEQGKMAAAGTPSQVGHSLQAQGDELLVGFPSSMRVALAVKGADSMGAPAKKDAVAGSAEGTDNIKAPAAQVHSDVAFNVPVTVREGRQWLALQKLVQDWQPRLSIGRSTTCAASPQNASSEASSQRKPIVSLSSVWYRYEKEGRDILRGLSLDVYPGELLCVVGGNGSGKSTSLKVLAGLQKPYRGCVREHGTKVKLGVNGLVMLPQDPQTVFSRESVREDLLDMLSHPHSPESEQEMKRVAALVDLEHLLDRHPYDLSGGEQQRAALAKILLTHPRILLLDEPTKGLDAPRKERLAKVLSKLKDDGVSIVMVSHDIEFCASFGDRCALLFDGQIVSEGETRPFFTGNNFYTTAANRMARRLIPEALTTQDIIAAIREA